MIKPNIREETANKLQPMILILDGIIEGKPIPKLAPIALNEILLIHNWLNKGDRQFSPKSVRQKGINKLISLETTCSMIIRGEEVSPADAKIDLNSINEIMAWLDKRKYKTGNK